MARIAELPHVGGRPDWRPSPPPNVPLRVGLLVAALLALVGVFFLGRFTAPATTAASPAPPARGGHTVIPSGPGPYRFVAGVGVGYSHNQAGAVAAATEFAKAQSSVPMLRTSTRNALLTAMVAPSVLPQAEAQQAQITSLIDRALHLVTDAREGVPVTYFMVPARYSVVSYGPTKAVVSVWGVGLAGSTNGTPVTAVWGTATETLSWVPGGWRQVNSTSATSPVPLTETQTPTPAATIIPQLNTWGRYINAPR